MKRILYTIFILFINYSIAQESEPKVIHAEDLLNQNDNQGRSARVWNLKKDKTIRINLVEMKGELKKHKHPDAEHSLIVIKGKVKVLVGDEVFILKQGDFISIPKNMPHKYWTISKKALLASMDAPYYDPKKTIYLE